MKYYFSILILIFCEIYSKTISRSDPRMSIPDLDDDLPNELDYTLINLINTDSSLLWRAEPSPRFLHESYETIAGMYGDSTTDSQETLSSPSFLEKLSPSQKKLPPNFDLRDHYQCASLREVPEQKNCGCCYIINTLKSLDDRLCMQDQKLYGKTRFSLQYFLSCVVDGSANILNKGCGTGDAKELAMFIHSYGAFIEDTESKKSSCVPFQANSLVRGRVPICRKRCANGDDWIHSRVGRDKNGVVTVLAATQTELVQHEIASYGSVVLDMIVYEDFKHYKAGIYKHKYGRLLGGHAVRVIGWGTNSQGVLYWIAVNSWGEKWGEKGFFKIDSSSGGLRRFLSVSLTINPKQPVSGSDIASQYAYDGNLEKFESLYNTAKNRKTMPIPQNSLQRSLLHNAVIGCHIEIVSQLLENSPDDSEMNAQDVHGRTALYYAHLYCDRAMVTLLENNRAELGTSVSGVSIATLKNNAKLLRSYQTIPVCYNDLGLHPLADAATHGFLESMSVLLSKNIDVDQKDQSGSLTAVSYTCVLGSTEAFNVLVKSHAKVTARSLTSACKSGHYPILQEYFSASLFRKTRGGIIDVNERNNEGKTLVHIAAEYERNKVIEALIRKRVDLRVLDDRGRTALHYACMEQLYVWCTDVSKA